MSASATRLLEFRIPEGLCDDTYLLPWTMKPHFDRGVERACRDAAGVAKLKHGEKTKGGFTLQGSRHTYITDLLAAGIDIPTVMKNSGHKSLASFSAYLHPTAWEQEKALQVIQDIDSRLGKVEALVLKSGETGGNEETSTIGK